MAGEGRDLLDIKDEYQEDADSCSPEELAEAFPLSYQVRKKTALSDSFQDSNTCVQVVTCVSGKTLAAANKKGNIILVDSASGTISSTLEAHTREITGLKFCPVNNSLLYSSSLDNSIKLLDLRSNKFEHSFEHKDESNKGREYSCLDVNCSGEFLCSGTNLVNDEDAYLMFWDVRKSQTLLGGYWESHSNDITQVKFHNNKRQLMASAAMDNLINLFDISKESEEDAFSQCINFETTPDAIYWDPHTNHTSQLFAVNHPQVVQYWHFENTKPTANLTATKMCRTMKRQVPDQCHLVSLNFDAEFIPLLMLSSNLGCSSQQNVCVRTLSYDREKKKLRPHSIFEIKGNKSLQMMDSVYLTKSDVFVTLESGCLKYWGQVKKKRSMDDPALDKTFQKKLRV